MVVVLPDTGERYLSKVHSDEWLTDNGMLDAEDLMVSDLLRMKRSELPQLVTIGADQSVREALDLIRGHDISQIPVTNGDPNEIVGTVQEGSLMSALLDGKIRGEDSVRGVMEPALPKVSGEESISQALKQMAEHRNAVLVDEGGRVTGIVSRFDLIEFVAR